MNLNLRTVACISYTSGAKLSRRGVRRHPTFSGFKMAAGPGIAPRLPVFRTGALTDSAIQRKLVLVRGNAPRSCGYRPRALLLSYTRKSGTSAWHRTKTSSLNRAADYCYPTLVKWSVRRVPPPRDSIWKIDAWMFGHRRFWKLVACPGAAPGFP